MSIFAPLARVELNEINCTSGMSIGTTIVHDPEYPNILTSKRTTAILLFNPDRLEPWKLWRLWRCRYDCATIYDVTVLSN